MARLKDYYKNDVAPALMKKFGTKVSCRFRSLKNRRKRRLWRGCQNSKMIDAVVADLTKITARNRCVPRPKSVANFKLREGMPIGAKVTLRGEMMYEFLDRFFNVALPRVRDFRGISADSFDGRGNYAVASKNS